MTERGRLGPSDPVHFLVTKRHRLTSEWFYEFCEKYSVDYPDEASPEQQDEYEAGMDAIYAQIRQEAEAESTKTERSD
ncbi:hypothetical protein AB0F13_01975 [Streptomyces sp. NPDC026206]|uniref:hypothetical protein n=1 Tax=Streptomyces sp. NPDC026206 TaxID=3157089 RepID=UPI0033FEF139